MPSQNNITNIPSSRVDFIDQRTGLMSREWYRFFLNLFNLTGAGNNPTSLDDLQVGPPSGGSESAFGTVTSVQVSGGTTGLTTSGGPITSAGTITFSGTLNVANGGTGATTAGAARTNLGATTIGGNMYTLVNPSAVTFPQFNADNTISALDATSFRTAIGAGTGTGSVTSVAATAGTGISVTGSPITTSGTLNITNTAPDQTVVLTDGTGISVTGTYPNFTITNTSPSSGGTVTSVGTSGTVNGLTLTGGPITSSGTVTLGGTLDLSSPPTIGNTTPNTGKFTTLTATGTSQFGTASANYQQMVGAATTLAPVLSVAGSDTNVALAIKTQGTGAIDLAAGSRGVNISNGGTVTAITRTAAGSNYTSIPTVAITAPTTAGGVQATATSTLTAAGTITIVSGGTGYTANDVLTVSGGTSTVVATITVTSVSGGVITGVSYSATGTYTVVPTNPVSVTGGTGSGATFNLLWAMGATFTITNAGSGYVEQPTVSFSGGAGSGASAYATVGSGTTVKTIGSTLDFVTPSGYAGFRVTDVTTASAVGYWTAYGGLAQPQLRAVGSTGGQILTQSAAPISFATNAGTQQFSVAHTASAVNYVQVTGAATGNPPRITAQGSDGLVSLGISSKGGGDVFFQTSGSSNTGFVVRQGTGTVVNYLQVASSATTAAPVLSAQGTDTNIDLALTPKGTGVLKTTAVANIGAGTVLSGATNPLVAMTGNTNQYVQSYIVNNNAGTSASSDFVAYANNSTDSHGWADMGFTSSVYADATYTVTGANEAYLFGSALNSTYTGNLVLATDSTGSANAIQFYTGGFTQAKGAWKAQIDSTGLKATQVNATNGIIANSMTVSANYTVATGDNAMSIGPMTVSAGVSVTVSAGSRWVVM